MADEFGIEISDRDAETLHTLAHVMALIGAPDRQALSEQPARHDDKAQ